MGAGKKSVPFEQGPRDRVESRRMSDALKGLALGF